MSKQLYFKLPIDKQLVSEIKDMYVKSEQKNLVFYIDLNGINKAGFNPSVIIQEIKDGDEHAYFLNDLKSFIKKLFSYFSSCNLKIVLFYDEGGSKQNKDIDSNYKAQRVGLVKQLLESNQITVEEGEKYIELRSKYNDIIEKKLNLKNKIVSINLKHYESDLVAHYYISKQLLPNSLNIIFAIDKDLLQSLKFPNTYQLSFSFKKTKGGWEKIIWNNNTAVTKIYEGFEKKLTKYGYSINNHPLTSKIVPYILALSGDTADNVPQLWYRLGPATAIDLINTNKLYNLTYDQLNKSTISDQSLLDNIERLKLNLELVDFDLQIKRLPKEITDYLEDKIKLLLEE